MKRPIPRDPYSDFVDPGVSFFDDPGLTDSSQADACDVNNIVNLYMKTGVLPGVDREAMFGDFADAPSYHDAMNLVLRADEQFASLDAKVRARFANDPASFLAFVSDPKNGQELIDLGLATPRPSDDVDAVEAPIQAPLPKAPKKQAAPKETPADKDA